MIEKTYQKEKLEQDYQVQEYAAEIRRDAKSLRAFSKKSKGAGKKNLLLSGVSGDYSTISRTFFTNCSTLCQHSIVRRIFPVPA